MDSKIDFLTRIIIENLNEKKTISIENILDICRAEKYLPNNRADAYHYLNKLVDLGIILKVKNGLYEVDQEKVGAFLNENAR